MGNFAIDLPDANVAIQVSGTFGSRQEEAQRLGRILRPEADGVTGPLLHARHPRHRGPGVRRNRQLFLTEQGYRYEILDEAEVADFQPATLAAECAPPRTLTRRASLAAPAAPDAGLGPLTLVASI